MYPLNEALLIYCNVHVSVYCYLTLKFARDHLHIDVQLCLYAHAVLRPSSTCASLSLTRGGTESVFEVSGKGKICLTQVFFILALSTTYSKLLHVRSKAFSAYTCIILQYTCLTSDLRRFLPTHVLYCSTHV